MTYHIDLTDEAKLNIKEASEYYLKISASLQDVFQVDLIKTIDRLKTNPKQHQIRYREIRIAHTRTWWLNLRNKNVAEIIKNTRFEKQQYYT